MHARSPWLPMLAVVLAVACGEGSAPAPHATEVVAERRAALATAPDAPEWRGLPTFAAALIPQDMVEPRLLAPSTAEVRVQALTDGTRIAFRLAWPDPTADDTPGPSRFSDACAVQLPARTEADVPARAARTSPSRMRSSPCRRSRARGGKRSSFTTRPDGATSASPTCGRTTMPPLARAA